MILCLFIVALPAEARPLVEHYRLRAQTNIPYRLYGNASIALVETGLGKLNAAAATSAALCTLMNNQAKVPVCVNVGLAGSENTIGNLLRAHRVTDADTQQKWYPQQTWQTPGETTSNMTEVTSVEVYTVSQPDNRYQPGRAFDMEASGVMCSATKHTTLEFVQCLKIVSDNPQNSIDSINKNTATELVASNTHTIALCVEQLVTLGNTLPDTNALELLLRIVNTHYKPSSSHKVQLSNLLQRHQALKTTLPSEQDLLQHTDTRSLLQSLQTLLDKHNRIY